MVENLVALKNAVAVVGVADVDVGAWIMVAMRLLEIAVGVLMTVGVVDVVEESVVVVVVVVAAAVVVAAVMEPKLNVA